MKVGERNVWQLQYLLLLLTSARLEHGHAVVPHQPRREVFAGDDPSKHVEREMSKYLLARPANGRLEMETYAVSIEMTYTAPP